MKNKKGFTLLELMVVIIIIAALSALAIPRFTGAMSDAKKKDALTLLKKLDSAVLLYYMDHPDHDIQGGPILSFSPTYVCPSTETYTNIFNCGYLDEKPDAYGNSTADYDFYVCNPYGIYGSESDYCKPMNYAVMVDSENCYGFDDDGEYVEMTTGSCLIYGD